MSTSTISAAETSSGAASTAFGTSAKARAAATADALASASEKRSTKTAAAVRDTGTPQSLLSSGARISSPTLPGDTSMEKSDKKYRLLRAKPVPAPIRRMYACQRAARKRTARHHRPANAEYPATSTESTFSETFCASAKSTSAAYIATGAASSRSQE